MVYGLGFWVLGQLEFRVYIIYIYIHIIHIYIYIYTYIVS
jgi:hypothetical protein